MKNRFGFVAFIFFILLCMTACADEESSKAEKQKEEPVAEASEKTEVNKIEETETKEEAAVVKTLDPKESVNEQIQVFMDTYWELEYSALADSTKDREKLANYFELFSWWSKSDSASKEGRLDNEENNSNVEDKKIVELVEINNDAWVSEGYGGALITDVLVDVESFEVGEDGEIIGTTYTDKYQLMFQLIPTENKYGWSVYDYYLVEEQTPVETVNAVDTEPIHIETALASIVVEEEHISYYQSAIHPQDVVLTLSNMNGETGGSVTPYQEGVFFESLLEYFNVPIKIKVGETLGIVKSESLGDGPGYGVYYRFESLEPNKRITEIITQGQEVIGKGKFVAVVSRIDNRDEFYILFEGI